jgi:hypothetical protein
MSSLQRGHYERKSHCESSEIFGDLSRARSNIKWAHSNVACRYTVTAFRRPADHYFLHVRYEVPSDSHSDLTTIFFLLLHSNMFCLVDIVNWVKGIHSFFPIFTPQPPIMPRLLNSLLIGLTIIPRCVPILVVPDYACSVLNPCTLGVIYSSFVSLPWIYDFGFPDLCSIFVFDYFSRKTWY